MADLYRVSEKPTEPVSLLGWVECPGSDPFWIVKKDTKSEDQQPVTAGEGLAGHNALQLPLLCLMEDTVDCA